VAVLGYLLHGFPFRPRIAYGARVVARAVMIEDGLYGPTNAPLRARMALAIFDGFGMASSSALSPMARSSGSCARAPTELARPGPMSPMRPTEKVGLSGVHQLLLNRTVGPGRAWRSSRLKSSALANETACLLSEQTIWFE